MQRVLIVFCLCISTGFSFGQSEMHTTATKVQDYQKFRVGFGSGFTLARFNQADPDGGILFTLEPAYHLLDDLLIVLRLEFADTDLYLIYG